MKLYYAPGACSLADHIALIEGGIDHTLIKVDLRTKTTEDGSDFLRVNPKGYVPALEMDDGAVLTENIAILSWIADRSGKLMAKDGLARYRTLANTAFASGELHGNFHAFFNPNASDAERDEARTTLGRRFGQIADELGDAPYLGGDRFDIADCYLFVTERWAQAKDVPLPEKLTAHLGRMRAEPSVARALSEQGLS